jgi:hypothetical protein
VAHEQTHRRALANLWSEKKKPLEHVMKEFHKSMNSTSQPHEMSIYRTLAHCLVHSRDLVTSSPDHNHTLESCVILFWQLFFNLYFESVQMDQLGDQRRVVKFFGFAFLDSIRSRNDLLQDIVASLDKLARHYAYKIQKMEVEATNEEAAELLRLYNRLHHAYTAMSLWIKESGPVSFLIAVTNHE